MYGYPSRFASRSSSPFTQCQPRRCRPRLKRPPHWHCLATSLQTLAHRSRRRVCMRGMVYRRLRMRTPSLRMLIPILADISPSVLLQLLRMSLTLWLLQTLPSNSHDPQRRRTRTTYRRSSTRPKRSRRTSSITLNWPPNRMYTTLQPGRREDQARNGKASDVRIGRTGSSPTAVGIKHHASVPPILEDEYDVVAV